MTPPLTAHDLHRLADAIKKDDDMYLAPLARIIFASFPLPSPESPVREDWRERCVVCTSSTEDFAGWGVYSPCGTYWLKFDGKEWGGIPGQKATAQYSVHGSESSARRALASAPPWPGYEPPQPPANDAPLLGYALVGPLNHNLYSWRSTKGGSRYEWGPSQGWYETCLPDYGHSTRDQALANPPTTPPPDYKPEPAPVGEGEKEVDRIALMLHNSIEPLVGADKFKPWEEVTVSGKAQYRHAARTVIADTATLRSSLQLSQGRVESLTAEVKRYAALYDGCLNGQAVAQEKVATLSARLLTADRENMDLAGRVEAAEKVCKAVTVWRDHIASLGGSFALHSPAYTVASAHSAWLANGGGAK